MNCTFHANIHTTVNIKMNIVITLNANGLLAQLLTLMFISKLVLTVIVILKGMLTLTTVYVLISTPSINVRLILMLIVLLIFARDFFRFINNRSRIMNSTIDSNDICISMNTKEELVKVLI